jgi:hypothetical protein
MANITMNISKSTVTASAFLVGNAYKHAVKLATAYEGKIGRTADNRFTVTFDEVKTAKKFKSEWTKDYKVAHASYVPMSERETVPELTHDELVERIYDEASVEKDLKWLEKDNSKKLFTSGKGSGEGARMSKREVRSWAWKEANGDREEYIRLCASKGVRAGA